MILGLPRSGTTWLAKIFDSHPDVFYCHEPDLVVRNTAVPAVCANTEGGSDLAETRRFVESLLASRTLKSAGSLPVFAKTGDRYFGRSLRLASVLALRFAQKTAPWLVRSHAAVPEFCDWTRVRTPHCVIKSVSSVGRAALLADALPEARIILIMRHPFGQIASRARGHSLGKLGRFRFDPALLATPQGARHGLRYDDVVRLSPVEQLAWEWAILNEKAFEELSARSNARAIRYIDLVSDPAAEAQRLFAFAGLPWHGATEAFIRKSVSYRGPDLYFQVMKDASRTQHKWRTQLSADEQARIASIVRLTSVSRLWPDLSADPVRIPQTAPANGWYSRHPGMSDHRRSGDAAESSSGCPAPRTHPGHAAGD
jgi:hypothetical protein